MSEHLQSSSPEEQPADKLAYIRDALRDAADSRRDDERRGAAYLSTGAHANSRYDTYQTGESQTGKAEDTVTMHDRAAEARASGDEAALAELQAEQDQWQLDGAGQGKRRVHVDVFNE